MKELWERFDYEWNQFTIEDLEPYYNSMPDKVLAYIKNKRGNTGYWLFCINSIKLHFLSFCRFLNFLKYLEVYQWPMC